MNVNSVEESVSKSVAVEISTSARVKSDSVNWILEVLFDDDGYYLCKGDTALIAASTDGYQEGVEVLELTGCHH